MNERKNVKNRKKRRIRSNKEDRVRIQKEKEYDLISLKNWKRIRET